MKLSIIIPVFNNGRFLRKCIESITCQEFKDFEIIIINDGSTDDSESICQSLINENSNTSITLISQKNSGVSSARNTGIINSSGYYITFVDSDDYLEPDALDFFLHNTSNLPDLIYADHYLDFGHKKKFVNQNFGNDIYFCLKKLIRQELKGYVCGKFFKREIVKKHNINFPTSITFMEDLHFVIQFLINAKIIYHIKKPIYNYVQHGGNSSKKKSIQNIESQFHSAKSVVQILKTRNLYEDYSKDIDYWLMKNKIYFFNSPKILKRHWNSYHKTTISSILKSDLKITHKVYYFLMEAKITPLIYFIEKLYKYIKRH